MEKLRPWTLAVLILLQLAAAPVLFGQLPVAHPIDIASGASALQYAFLSPLLEGAEVVSLAESIHMTHEFPLIRIGMVRWMNERLGFGVVAMEGSPEDLWVSQDVFLRDPSNLAQSTSGLFGVWNTAEMRQLFAYEASTWATDHPLYITAYDIQPGTGRASGGARVFHLLAQRLARYAPPPPNFEVDAWSAGLSPLTDACSRFQIGDEARVQQAIGVLQEWIDRGAPNLEAAFPHLPHAAALRLIPANLQSSLALCTAFVSGASSGAGLYKTTRDTYAAQSVLRLQQAAPRQKLILWAHVSHLFYDADGFGNTSVGQILRASLGSRLYTIGVFAQSGSAIMLFSDWNRIAGYGRIWGVSSALKRTIGRSCPAICFFDIRHAAPGSVLASRQHVWFEAWPWPPVALAKDFDGIVWVRHVHPPQMPLLRLLAYSTPRYWGALSLILLCLIAVVTGALFLLRRLRKPGLGTQE